MIATMTPDDTALAPATPNLSFVLPLPGFPEARSFVLEPVEEQAGVLSILRCTDAEGPEFVVAVPEVFFPDYSPEIDETTAERLGVTRAEDALVFVILTVAEQIEHTTANLMAPVIVNRHTGDALQALLVASSYEIRTPLVS